MKLPPTTGHNSGEQRLVVRYVDPKSLTTILDSPRKLNRHELRRAKRILRRFKIVMPIVIDETGRVIVGEQILCAAIELNLPEIPVVDILGLSPAELDAMSVAYARLLETGSFDRGALGALLTRLEIEIPDLDFGDLGLEVAEIDLALATLGDEGDEERVPTDGPPVARLGDLFRLDKHRLLVGDATCPLAMARLVNGRTVSAMFADAPYNLNIAGFVSSKIDREFVVGSGEMSREEFVKFLSDFMAAATQVSAPSAIHFLCMDWRHISELMDAAAPHYDRLLNLCVWVKNRMGQGSGYRSQHELVFVYRVGKAKHRNNIALGKFGRSRSNVWQYDAAASFLKAEEAGNLVANHPSPKNTKMVADAVLDCTARGEIVLDPFLGSGTTMIACDRVGRICYGLELDPVYADMSVRRWQIVTGEAAIHDETGLTFDALAELRAKDASNVR